jgi:hypothetical protein
MQKFTIEVAYTDNTEGNYGWMRTELPIVLRQLNVDTTIRIAPSPIETKWDRFDDNELYELTKDLIEGSSIRKNVETKGEWYLHLLVAPLHRNKWLGIMYDNANFDPRVRQACAVFEAQIAYTAYHVPKDIMRLMKRCALHEIGHCLDLKHRNDKTLMTQTQDLQTDQDNWIRKLSYVYAKEDCNYVRDNPENSRPGGSTKKFAINFSGEMYSDNAKSAAISLSDFDPKRKSSFQFGEPISLMAKIRNTSSRRLSLALPLDANSENMKIWLKHPDGRVVKRQKLINGCGCLRETLDISKDDFRLLPIHLYADRNGYLFSEPGNYEIKIAVKDKKGDWLVSGFQSFRINRSPLAKAKSRVHLDKIATAVELGSDLMAGKQSKLTRAVRTGKHKNIQRAVYWNLLYVAKKKAQRASTTKKRSTSKVKQIAHILLKLEKSPIKKGKIILDLSKAESILMGREVSPNQIQKRYVAAYEAFNKKSIKSNHHEK